MVKLKRAVSASKYNEKFDNSDNAIKDSDTSIHKHSNQSENIDCTLEQYQEFVKNHPEYTVIDNGDGIYDFIII
ncbi:MAG: hypothetical protein IKY83_11425 [Proteobacteria bacterium]|nr:hypothetical protein [Pseudomonadota bacterium]